jgi:hypothetical protein
MTIRISEVIHEWMGWCPNAVILRLAPPIIGTPSASVNPAQPDGGAGGSRTIRRGIGAALSGTKTLARNPQLLWFTLLAGLVLAGNTIGQAAFWYFEYNLHMQLYWIVWQFFIELATLFCLVFLLAGLVLSISSKKEGSASFFVELAGAKKYLKAIFLWSFVLALAGMLLDMINFYFYGVFSTHIYGFLISTLNQFPFTLTLNPSTFAEIPGYGGRSPLFWTYPYGFMEALIFSAINLLLFILTPFVVPLIVLEQKTLREAVAGSFAIMKKTWVEEAACAVFLGVVVFGVFLTYLLVQAAHGMVTPPHLLYDRPTDTWIALGLLYYLALFSVAFVVATVGGIAALDLYTSAKTGQMPKSAETEPSA